MKKSFRFLLVSALVLLTGALSSCNKEEKLVLYSFHCDVTDRTAPSAIEDPEIREVYTKLLTDLLEDLGKLRMNETCETHIVGGNYGPEDEKQTARYDANLPALKDIEARYKKRIEDLGESDGPAFFIHVAVTLSRSTPADMSSTVSLREYDLDLRYGYSDFVLFSASSRRGL